MTWLASFQTGDGKRMLVLHIGTGKAGSTTIQGWLKENRLQLSFGQLENFGFGNAWKIAAVSGTDRSYRVFVENRKRLDKKAFSSLQANFWKDVLAEYEGSTFTNVIASSEHIFRHYGDNYDAILALRENLQKIFGKILIVVYLRNQVDFVKSKYAQGIKGPAMRTMPYEEYIFKLKQLEVPIHYAHRLRLWGEAFGWENTVPVVFDKRNFKNGNLLEDFCHRTGILNRGTLEASAFGSKNISPPVSHLEVIRILNKLGIKNRKFKKWAAGAFMHFVPKKEHPTEYDQYIIDQVSSGNKWLNVKFFSGFEVKLPTSKGQPTSSKNTV